MTDKEKMPCKCPYCESELKDDTTDKCSFCNVEINFCSQCSYPVSDKVEKCPNCGAKC